MGFPDRAEADNMGAELQGEQTEQSTNLATEVARIHELLEEVSRVVVGQKRMIERLLIGLFTGGHVLLEGVPGLAKTLIVNTLADTLGLHFQRIQFTPDLLPADLIGTMVYNSRKEAFQVKKGPIFSQIVLADEINRAPAKVQSALLEAMQEKQVTIGETTYPLEQPFLVLATQNPLEQEGTYPLPEAQVDRFMMRVFVDYPNQEEELLIMQRMADLSFSVKVRTILQKDELQSIRSKINSTQLSESLAHYIVSLISATRMPAKYNMEDLAPFVQFGASPRGSIYLHVAARAHAFLQNRDYVLPEDVKAMAPGVLNHRIVLTYEAEAEGLTSHDFINKVLEKVPIQR